MSEEYRQNLSKAEKEKTKKLLARAKRKGRLYDELEAAIVLLLAHSSPPRELAIGWEEHEIVSELYRQLIIDKGAGYYISESEVIKVKLSQERERFANQVRYRLKRLANLGLIRTWKKWVEGRGLRQMGAEIRYYSL